LVPLAPAAPAAPVPVGLTGDPVIEGLVELPEGMTIMLPDAVAEAEAEADPEEEGRLVAEEYMLVLWFRMYFLFSVSILFLFSQNEKMPDPDQQSIRKNRCRDRHVSDAACLRPSQRLQPYVSSLPSSNARNTSFRNRVYSQTLTPAPLQISAKLSIALFASSPQNFAIVFATSFSLQTAFTSLGSLYELTAPRRQPGGEADTKDASARKVVVRIVRPSIVAVVGLAGLAV
jgi:hypothetical protein